MSKTKRAPAATFVVFGATGDLTRRLLAPALVNLADGGLLDDATKLVGIGHSDGSHQELRDALGQFVDDKKGYDWLKSRISYIEGDFTSDDLYVDLAKLDLKNAVFYLAVAERFFGPTVEHLGHAGLTVEHGDSWRRGYRGG